MTLRIPILVLGLGLLAVSSGCGRIGTTMARKAGWTGWFEITLAATALPDPDEEAPDPEEAYLSRFDRRPLSDDEGECLTIRAALEAPSGPVFILIHGVHGDGEEFHDIPDILATARPSATYMFRWVAYSHRDEIVSALSAGVNRLLECLPGKLPIVILAHSAGGVLAARAAATFAVRPKRPGAVRVLTVASPLAGTGRRKPNRDGRPEVNFFLDLGTRLRDYPPAAPGVRVVHLRTSPPADDVMLPSEKGHAPNDPSVGVPGAPQIDLPVTLGHTESLRWVAQRVADGSWVKWFDHLPPE